MLVSCQDIVRWFLIWVDTGLDSWSFILDFRVVHATGIFVWKALGRFASKLVSWIWQFMQSYGIMTPEKNFPGHQSIYEFLVAEGLVRQQQRIDQSVQSSIFTNSLQSFLGWTVSSCNQLPKSTTVEMKWLCVWPHFVWGGAKPNLFSQTN